MKNLLAIIFVSVIFTSCSNKAKNSLGLTETIPDEYQVRSFKPLEIPPHYKAALNKPEDVKN